MWYVCMYHACIHIVLQDVMFQVIIASEHMASFMMQTLKVMHE